jgi:hypothetical protein
MVAGTRANRDDRDPLLVGIVKSFRRGNENIITAPVSVADFSCRSARAFYDEFLCHTYLSR